LSGGRAETGHLAAAQGLSPQIEELTELPDGTGRQQHKPCGFDSAYRIDAPASAHVSAVLTQRWREADPGGDLDDVTGGEHFKVR
jgi:hypothetical protein